MDIIKLTIVLVVYFATVEGAGPGKCAGQCIGDISDYNLCTAANATMNCSQSAIGDSHCYVASADYIYLDDKSNGTGAINGCIDCADKAKACEELKKTALKTLNVTLTSCAIDCCTTSMCNYGVDPPKPTTAPPPTTSPTTTPLPTSSPTAHGLSSTSSPFVLLAAFAVCFGF